MAAFPAVLAIALATSLTIGLTGCGGSANVQDGAIVAAPERSDPVLLTVVDVERAPTTIELLDGMTVESLPPYDRGDYLIITVRFSNPEDGVAWPHLGELAVSWNDEWIWGEKSEESLGQDLLLEAGQSVEYTYEFKLAGATVDEVTGPEDVLFYYKEDPGTLYNESFASARRSATAVVPLSELWSGPFRTE